MKKQCFSLLYAGVVQRFCGDSSFKTLTRTQLNQSRHSFPLLDRLLLSFSVFLFIKLYNSDLHFVLLCLRWFTLSSLSI